MKNETQQPGGKPRGKNRDLFNYYWRQYSGVACFVTSIICIAIFWPSKCNRSENQPELTDSLQTQNLEIKRRIIPRKHRIDQEKAEITKAKKAAQTLYDTIIVYMPDTCKPYLATYKAFRDSTEKLLLYVLASQDSIIRDQDTIIHNQDKMLRNDSVAIRDTVKYWRRWGVRRGRKGFGIGFAAGYGVRELGRAIKNLKP